MIDWRLIDEKNDLKLNVVITGGNSGIGFETLKFLVARGADVIFGARSKAKAESAIKECKRLTPKAKVRFVPLDLADTNSIKDFSDEVKAQFSTIDVLINNAGIMAVPYRQTLQGFELQMGINHLGHFILTEQLMTTLSPTARIVNVSSQASLPGKIHWDDIFFEAGRYSPFKSYAQSKLANLLFTEGLKSCLEKSQITVVSAHPGLAKTGLFNRSESSRGFKIIFKLLAPFAQSAEKGARPLIAGALSEHLQSGDFLGPKVKGKPNFISTEERKNPIALDQTLVQKFWDWSQTATGISFDC